MKLRLTSIALCLSAASLVFASSAFAKGGDGGGGTSCDTTPVLPTTAPAPDVIMRDSFGLGDRLVRPTGGKGCNKADNVHTDISGFWVEYPGSKNTAWLAPAETNQTWRFCAMSDNPNEMPSPLQGQWGNGCIASDWFDFVATRPTALVPFTQPATPYEISIEVWPATAGNPDYYLGFGLTDNSILESNLETSAGVWIELKVPELGSYTEHYALRANGRTGPVLASGTTFFDGRTRTVLRYDPATQTVSASINGVELGSFQVPIKAPRFIGIEGVGIMDNFVVRTLP